jgi:hypothetical protein
LNQIKGHASVESKEMGDSILIYHLSSIIYHFPDLTKWGTSIGKSVTAIELRQLGAA